MHQGAAVGLTAESPLPTRNVEHSIQVLTFISLHGSCGMSQQKQVNKFKLFQKKLIKPHFAILIFGRDSDLKFVCR